MKTKTLKTQDCYYKLHILGILRGFEQFGTIPTENDSYEILIKNSSEVVIASVLWKIAFNADQESNLRIGETFRVIFTDQGMLDVFLFHVSYYSQHLACALFV